VRNKTVGIIKGFLLSLPVFFIPLYRYRKSAVAGSSSESLRKSQVDAVRQVLEGQRDVTQKIAGDWLDHQALVQINNLNLCSSQDTAYPLALRIVRSTFPEVTAMADFGTVSEMAMRIVFIGWFKD
jgi:hypothetical protein